MTLPGGVTSWKCAGLAGSGGAGGNEHEPQDADNAQQQHDVKQCGVAFLIFHDVLTLKEVAGESPRELSAARRFALLVLFSSLRR